MLKIVFFVVLFAHVKSLTILDENTELKNDAIHSYNKHIKFIDSYPTKVITKFNASKAAF